MDIDNGHNIVLDYNLKSRLVLSSLVHFLITRVIMISVGKHAYGQKRDLILYGQAKEY